MIRAFWLTCLSVVGGVTTALTFAATIGPGASLKSLTLPAVAEIACLFGAVAGLLLAPLMIWSLHDKNLWVGVPGIYSLAWLSIILLNRFGVRSSELIALGVTGLALFVYGLIGKRHPHGRTLDGDV